jgi:4-hydroxy 2-oxovalerate aldolase
MISFYDVTLRDGNHALRHTLTPEFVREYCEIAEQSGLWAIEVGHGNGIGASSFLVGKAKTDDRSLLNAAREHLKRVKLAVHAIPGFATIKRDIIPAIESGVDVFRIGTHVTEVTTAQRHVEYLAEHNLTVHGVLMMSHAIDLKGLVTQAKLMADYGASAVVIMDSAGNYVPSDVARRVSAIKEEVGVQVGFHAHNNLGVGVSNAISAIENHATIIDGSSMGLGAGAGNAPLESIIVNYRRMESTAPALEKFLDMSHLVEMKFPEFLPRTTSSSIRSGDAGVFSGFAPQVRQLSAEFGVSQEDLWQELGKRRLVAGQESMIREIAQDLMNL